MILIYCAFALVLRAVSAGADSAAVENVPSWITDSPGYKTPKEVDSIAQGNGTIETSGVGSRGWLVSLNQKAGHGIEVELEKLSLNPDSGDFFMISTWPLGGNFKQIRLITGKFEKPLKKIHIPNSKTFFLLYSATKAENSPEMIVNYRRYGSSLELDEPPTENPAKKKETVFEVQLRGKTPEDYSDRPFLQEVKEAVRAAARRYCAANNISFNERIPTEEMVLIHKITFCPFEWPDRDICASLKHSVFVSGVRIPGESIILDYELTADHLRAMWNHNDFPELEKLGITVFQLPASFSTVSYWALIIGLTIISSLVVTYIVWKFNKPAAIRPEEYSTPSEEFKQTTRQKLRIPKHQRVPSFMYDNPSGPPVEKFNESALMTATEESIDDILKPGRPIQNYGGSIFFSSNRSFDDDEDKPVELNPKPLLQNN